MRNSISVKWSDYPRNLISRHGNVDTTFFLPTFPHLQKLCWQICTFTRPIDPTSLAIFTYLHQDSACQAETSSLIRIDPDNSGATADFVADTFKQVQYRGFWSCSPAPDSHKQKHNNVDDIIHITWNTILKFSRGSDVFLGGHINWRKLTHRLPKN